MLPEYKLREFTIADLTDDVVKEALDKADINFLSVNTVRDACFDWMKHSSVLNQNYEPLKKEFDAKFGEYGKGYPLLNLVKRLSDEIGIILAEIEVFHYKDSFVYPKEAEIKKTMNRLLITVPVELMELYIATYQVFGWNYLKTKYGKDIASYHIALGTVVKIASTL